MRLNFAVFMDQYPSMKVSFCENLDQMGNTCVIKSQTVKIKYEYHENWQSRKIQPAKIKVYNIMVVLHFRGYYEVCAVDSCCSKVDCRHGSYKGVQVQIFHINYHRSSSVCKDKWKLSLL